MRMFALSLLLLSSSAFALQVTGATYNLKADQLEIQIQYMGGCFEHRFELHLVNCAPSRTENIGIVNVCDGKIIDITDKEDRCKAEIKRQLNVFLGALDNDMRPVLVGFESGVVLVAKKG